MHFARKHHKSLFSTGADSRNHIHTKVGVRFSQPPAFALSAPKSYHDHNPSEHSLYRQNQYLPPCFLARFLPPAEPPPQTASPDTDSIPGPRITKVKRLSLSTRGGATRRAIRQFEPRRADCEKALVLKAVQMAIAFAPRIVCRVFAGNLRVANDSRHGNPPRSSMSWPRHQNATPAHTLAVQLSAQLQTVTLIA